MKSDEELYTEALKHKEDGNGKFKTSEFEEAYNFYA
jgi:hypothetical protein